MIQKLRDYWKSVAQITNTSHEQCDRFGCAIKHYCQNWVHKGSCDNQKCYRIHAKPPEDKKWLVPEPRQQTGQGNSNWQRHGGAAQADNDVEIADDDAVAALAQIIIEQEEEETITSRRDYLLRGGTGVTPLHPEEAFNGRA